MKDIDIIQMSIAIKEVFGSHRILDEIDVVDHPAIYHFATIVSNYLKLKRISETE